MLTERVSSYFKLNFETNLQLDLCKHFMVEWETNLEWSNNDFG